MADGSVDVPKCLMPLSFLRGLVILHARKRMSCTCIQGVSLLTVSIFLAKMVLQFFSIKLMKMRVDCIFL